MVLNKENMRFKTAIIVFITGILLNTVAAYLNMGQSPVRTILSFEFYYFILLYFLLHYLKIERKFLENTVIIFAFIYLIIFIIQYRGLLGLNNVLYRDVSTADEEKQLEIIGHGFLMLGFYLLLNRYFVNYNLINVFLAIVLFFAQLKSGFRTLLAGSVVIAGIMALRLVRFKIKDFALIFVFIIVVIGLSQNKQIQKVYNDLVTKTEGDIKEGDKYVRYLELEFFFKRYPQNITYYLIGGGKPSGANLSNFDLGRESFNYNIVWVDIGLIGFYIVIGGVTLLGLLLWAIKAMFIKLPRDALYLNMYFLYLFIVSFTNEEIYRNGIFSVQAVALYLIDMTLSDQKELKGEFLNTEVISAKQ
jgi:hypothetical protein